MGYLLTTSCYIISFAPAFALFHRFIVHDPVRIILFVLGAFFWLVALLLSSLIWLGLGTLFDGYVVSIVIGIFLQELARVSYFLLLKEAQSGLNKITRPGEVSVAPGVTDLHNARHMLALVCGLGMGVMSGLFLTMNVFAAFSGPGTIGLPQAIEKSTTDVNRAGKYLPFFYALSALLLTLFHITWTIMVWDFCHKFGRTMSVYIPAVIAVVTHLAVSIVSSISASGLHFYVLVVQFLVFLGCAAYCHVIMGGTLVSLLNRGKSSAVDLVTLRFLRNTSQRYEAQQGEPLQVRNVET
ncbi:unnamed protein product [Caenorhabditis auriculariae]|uniref:Gamma-secretase subunit aph-1 n=1 Tax=Caenorhabditis auriculariae TaxID=2777116 RepID=A0A8S1GMP4_9PELO|nr:unnamed protein product [Caenorhabditis auriculariae]